MSERARMAVFGLAVAMLVGAGAYFALREDSAEPPSDRGAIAASAPAQRASASEQVLTEIRHHKREEVVAEARREDPINEEDDHGQRPHDLQVLEDEGERAEPIARRFFSAFALYELGDVDRRIDHELRATATAAFARELLAAPPRIPPGTERLARAKLGRLEFVAGKADPKRRRLVSGELVGSVDRAGKRSPLAIGVIVKRGGWRVAGLGR